MISAVRGGPDRSELTYFVNVTIIVRICLLKKSLKNLKTS